VAERAGGPGRKAGAPPKKAAAKRPAPKAARKTAAKKSAKKTTATTEAATTEANATSSSKGPLVPAPSTRTAPSADGPDAGIPVARAAPASSPAPMAGPVSSAWATPRDFDPATGTWLPPRSPDLSPAGIAPDAARKGTVRYTLLTILLWIDLVVLSLFTLFSIVLGAILLFAPDSAAADDVREMLASGDESGLITNTLLSFLLFGVIPFVWVLGTRQQPWEGTKRFLRLHDPAQGILRGVMLGVLILVALAVVMSAYTLATKGVDGFKEVEEEPNPAVDALLQNLTWPIVVLVALGAGIGEEIFFRGFLQRYLGVWGQGILFGLAHATGGYVPQILFAFALGILFGYLLKRGVSLWTLITAHALYDFTLLALALVAPEIG
jgi:membrane protease YdiL (CAAX protease family)